MSVYRPMALCDSIYIKNMPDSSHLAKTANSQLAIGTSLNELQLFKYAMIAQNSDNIFSVFSDFYNTSEFRDLLFHNQKMQYTLPEIEQALSQLNLSFTALFVDQTKQSLFRQEYPEGNIHDLSLWNQLKLNPLRYLPACIRSASKK